MNPRIQQEGRGKSHNGPPETWEKDIATLDRSKFYLVSRNGPLLFVLRTETKSDNVYKVWISSPFHRCSCGGGESKGKNCDHILFVLIKILRLSTSNPLSWKLRVTEDDVENILSESHRNDGTGQTSKIRSHEFLRRGAAANRSSAQKVDDKSESPDQKIAARKELGIDERCPICQNSMTNLELMENLLCFCSSCGSSFHSNCFLVFKSHARSEKKQVLCPLCRSACNVDTKLLLNKGGEKGKSKTATRTLPTLRCLHCRVTIRNQFVRCAVCPSTDICIRCFDGGAVTTLSHDFSHPWFMASVTQYPAQWVPKISVRLREKNEILSQLQFRDLSPADYQSLLALDSNAMHNVPLYDHLSGALREVPSDHSQKCIYCSVPLSIDRTVREIPCRLKHTVHRSCAASIILSAISVFECEEISVGSILCPFCCVDGNIEGDQAFMFPRLRREPETKPINKEECESKFTPAPAEVTNLSHTLSSCILTKSCFASRTELRDKNGKVNGELGPQKGDKQSQGRTNGHIMKKGGLTKEDQDNPKTGRCEMEIGGLCVLGIKGGPREG